MSRITTCALILMLALSGLLADEAVAQRRRKAEAQPTVAPRSAPTPAPSRRATPAPAPSRRATAAPARRTSPQEPPSRRADPNLRRQDPPSPRTNPQPSRGAEPAPRVPTPTRGAEIPSRRSEPTPRVQQPPSRRVEAPTPSRRVEAPTPSRRVEAPTPSRRVEAPTPSRRVEAPTPDRRSATPTRDRRTAVPTPGREVPDSSGNRRFGEDPRRGLDSGGTDERSTRGSRGFEGLKRYNTDRSRRDGGDSGGRTTTSGGAATTPRTDLGGSGSSRLGSGSRPGSGFSGTGRDGAAGGNDGATAPGSSTPVRPRNRSVFPESGSRGVTVRPEGADSRSRISYGRGGLSTVTPGTSELRRGPSRSRVAEDRISPDAPTRRTRTDGALTPRLQPIDAPADRARGRDDARGDARGDFQGRREVRSDYFRGSDFWGLGRDGGRRRERSSFSFAFGFGGGRDYSGSYLFGAGYSSYWNYWSFGIVSPYHRGYASPAHVYFGYQSGFRRHARYHFGYSWYVPCSRRTPYPFYRTCYWQPWYVDYWADVCPTYRTYYFVYEDVYVQRPVYYVETADPYVEEEVLIPVSDIDLVDDDPGYREPELAGGVPISFDRSFSDSVPLDLGFDELLAWGEEALFSRDYLGAAEAFRRAAKLRWEDDYPKFQLALALFGAERYDLAYLALEIGLDQNPAWLYRRFDLRDAFASLEEFADRLGALERYLIRNDRHDEARFLLGYLYYFSDNLFGARSVVRILADQTAGRFAHLDILAREAEKRILREGR